MCTLCRGVGESAVHVLSIPTFWVIKIPSAGAILALFRFPTKAAGNTPFVRCVSTFSKHHSLHGQLASCARSCSPSQARYERFWSDYAIHTTHYLDMFLLHIFTPDKTPCHLTPKPPHPRRFDLVQGPHTPPKETRAAVE